MNGTTWTPSKPCSPSCGLPLHRFSDHDVQTNVLLLTLQIDLFDDFEPKLAIDNGIGVVGALQIASSTFGIKLQNIKVSAFNPNSQVIPTYLLRDMLNQFPRISMSPTIVSRPDIDEAPRLSSTTSHHLLLCLVKQRQELIKESRITLSRDLEFESPHPAQQDLITVVNV